MSELWFTRARLRRSGSAAALASLLTEADHLDQRHAVVWSLFADTPDRRRDFLWRETERRLFYLLSARLPVDAHRLFDLDPPKSFSPRLTAGCRLQFSLHANPVVRRGSAEAQPGGNGHRVRKDNVVMSAINRLPKGERAAAASMPSASPVALGCARKERRQAFSSIPARFSPKVTWRPRSLGAAAGRSASIRSISTAA